MIEHYHDSTTLINDQVLRLKGLILPFLSIIEFKNSEIEGISVVALSKFNRLNLLGTQNLKTWWTFDLKRPFKKYGFIIQIKQGKYNVGFTVADFDFAHEVLIRHYGKRLRDLRF